MRETSEQRALFWRVLAARMERWARRDPSSAALREAARIAREGADHYGAEEGRA